jgi:exopolysaccharide biosynthesis polyprenyl glycosylphosphotransferase
MFRRFSINFALLSIFIDSIIVALALTAATVLRPILNSLPLAEDVASILPIPYILYPLFVIAWIGIFLLTSVYDGRRNIYIVDELSSLSLSSMLAGVTMAGLLYLSYRDVSRVLFLAFVFFGFVGMTSWRMLARVIFRELSSTKTQHRRVLIIGAGPVGRNLEKQISQHSYMGLEVVGFLDDDLLKRARQRDILGPLTDTPQILSQLKIDDVVIALPNRAYERVNTMVAELHRLPVKVWVIPDYFGLALHKAVVEEFAGLPMLDLRAPALNDYQRMIKRAFDITLTISMLPFLLPVMGLIALAIRLEGEGPILFLQQRVGENGRLFNMYKFRSMVPEAETMRRQVERRDSTGRIIHKQPDDPRVTRVGRFLRRTSLDELPQIFNILRGEMSLVGPRPELPYLVDLYEPWQRKRFAVPQGITGWWQVNGRSDKPMHLHTEDDLYYVQHYSLLLDIQILFKTVLVVLRGKGAY